MSAILNSLRNLASSSRTTTAGDANARFGLTPGSEGPGEGGFAEWLHAMRLVARLPAGVPQHFRKKLWLTLAEKHLTARGIEWAGAERACFRGTAMPDDTELSAQILKDLHRTGCSLFCGAEGRENQAMLRRVLLAYARWNKDVGYCQGFNMLAAIILEVMEKSESDSLKVMIYLVEAVLPEGYFADDLRGLSADMAAFRDLLRIRLPRLAAHMDHLQKISDGGGIEPPLPDVFTMQWFLTLYATWLPRESLLRIWDLILLDGNEILLLTALAIWDMLQDRIVAARSADEFYSCMGGGAGAVWAAGDALVARVVAFGAAPELPRLRNLHRYRVTPPAPPATRPPVHSAMQTMTKKGLRLFYSEDEGDSSDDGNKMALATVIPRRDDRAGAGDRLSLDIGALKRQYARLRERQRQAHVILAAACARHAAVGVPTSPTSLTVNNLLLGKSAIVSSRGRRLGPPPGAIPPSRQTVNNDKTENKSKPSTETLSWEEEKSRKSQSRRNSVQWKDVKKQKKIEVARKASIDLDEIGDGEIVSEFEANEIIASVRSRSDSQSSTYSSHSESSTDTSLCDENEKESDSELELPNDDKQNKTSTVVKIDKTVALTLQKDMDSKVSTVKSETKKHHNELKIGTEKGQHKVTTPVQRVISPSIKDVKSKDLTIPKAAKDLNFEENIRLDNEYTNINKISEYLDSAAGKPLKTYIDGFETKLNKQTINRDAIELAVEKALESHRIPPSSLSLPKTNYRNLHLDTENISEIERPKSITKAKDFFELSPVSPSDSEQAYGLRFTYDRESYRSPRKHTSFSLSRPPDIIDSFAMYPNFVPDIDLSDKCDSPQRSPGSESVLISEDEPPILLKIDKYFEHSPDFFGARITDPNNADIPSRRPPKRNSRVPKKPDSLTLYNNGKSIKNDDVERASSLPQSHTFSTKPKPNLDIKENEKNILSPKTDKKEKLKTPEIVETPKKDIVSELASKDFNILRLGRKNSERALQIIQENSQILSRILTKQNISNSKNNSSNDEKSNETSKIKLDSKPLDSPLLKESTSDSLIGDLKRSNTEETFDKTDFSRVRPISIDDPFSFEVRDALNVEREFLAKPPKTPSSECLANKTDYYGWENKGFYAKSDYKKDSRRSSINEDNEDKKIKRRSIIDADLNLSKNLITDNNLKTYSLSSESKISVTMPSTEIKDTSFERRLTSDDYNYPFSTPSKYNDYVLSKVSDICNKAASKEQKGTDNLQKSDVSDLSDFSQRVTSSISFTYEPSLEDDSPIGAKSNSSDTLCQITSLDQVSTPISPKIFPARETPVFSKDAVEKSDKTKTDGDDTGSAITSLLETDTLSSLSLPRSPSTSSYHPFPSRPVLRLPKDIGVKLGMYPKDPMKSPQKQ
ncbi:uncharacterized protein LOC121731103 isoform X1 [Aricia agestis]|uniref:uncharacterized protein LOC121731103 isoform X1 n=1 Tax=Aricia agestis TaxID=91739 RepID=UPI001C205412|nr:uncharacterized protein LOC121731103 isoform X1 [Aricia agestis]